MRAVMRLFLCACVCVTVGVRVRAGAAEGVGSSTPAVPGGGQVEESSTANEVKHRELIVIGAGEEAKAREASVLSLALERRKQLLTNRIAHAPPALTPPKPLRNITSSEFRNSPSTTFARKNSTTEATPVSDISKEHAVASTKSPLKLYGDASTKPTPTKLNGDASTKGPPKLYGDVRARAGFMAHRRKHEETTTSTTTLMPPVVDVDEEFQVDESSHGIYFLLSDNVTEIIPPNITDESENLIKVSSKEGDSKRRLKGDPDRLEEKRMVSSRPEDEGNFPGFGQKLTTPATILNATTASITASKDGVRDTIEKNKARSSLRGPVPPRHISLLNAYRKPLSPSSPPPDISHKRPLRRRPIRPSTVKPNDTSPTTVYTAVVTSVSITSSVKSQNGTEAQNVTELRPAIASRFAEDAETESATSSTSPSSTSTTEVLTTEATTTSTSTEAPSTAAPELFLFEESSPPGVLPSVEPEVVPDVVVIPEVGVVPEVVVEVERGYTASYVLAGLGLLPLAAVLALALRHFALHRTKRLDTDYDGCFEEDDVSKKEPPLSSPPRTAPPPAPRPDHKWEFPRSKLRLQTLLGQGNFGQVWKAEADDLSGHDGLTRLVAVKTIKDEATAQEKQELLHEICIMHKIGPHPNVVTLLACCTEQEPYLLVMEYVMCGKLLTYLRERRARPDRFGGGGGALTSRDLTVFAYCVARGMEYLASKRIVHRDLAARNILVDHNKLCKIADFGMSRELGSESSTTEANNKQRHALPIRWMAPEALLYNVFSHETDVWAYGILLWEIVTLGSTPYAAMSGREVLAAVTEGYRLERPAHCSPALFRAMHACWAAAPSSRPRFGELKAELAELLEREASEGHYVDLDSFYRDSSVYSDAAVRDSGERSSSPPRRASALRPSASAAALHAASPRARRPHVPRAVARHSFSGAHRQRASRVPEFECDI